MPAVATRATQSRMKIGPRVRARTFRIRYLACSRPRAACGRHRILHPVSFTSGSPDTILGAGETSPNPATVPNLWGSSPGDSTAARYSRRAPTPARAGLRKGGPAFCRNDRLCSVVHSHLFESCKRYGKSARLGRSCSRAAPYPRGSDFSPVTANPFPVQPNEFPFCPRTGIGSQSVDSTSRLRGRSA